MMYFAVQCVFSLFLVLLICKSNQQVDVLPEGNVTCSTMLTKLGQTAHVICHYPVDIRNSSLRPLSLDVELYQNQSTHAEQVLTCQWLSGTTDTPCSTTEGYNVSGTVDRQLVLNITTLSAAHLGRYVCKIMSPGFLRSNQVPCIMALPENGTIGTTDCENKMYAIIGGVVGGVLLVVVVVVVFLVRTKRQICTCCPESKRDEQPHNTQKQRPRLCCAKSSDSARETIVSLSTKAATNYPAKKEVTLRSPEVAPLIRLDREKQEREKRLLDHLKKMEKEILKREAEMKAREDETRKNEKRLYQIIQQNRQVRQGYKILLPLSSATDTITKPPDTTPPLPPKRPKAPLAKVSEYDVPPVRDEKVKSDETYDISEYPWVDFPLYLDKPNKKIPTWANAENLEKAVEEQDTNPPNLDAIFPLIVPPDLNEMFEHKRSRFDVRTSSANWHWPPHKHNAFHKTKC